jgi:transposase
LRHRVINAVCGGMKQTKAAQVFGVSLRAVNKWVAVSKRDGRRALKVRRRGRNIGSGHLDLKQQQRIKRMVIGRMPEQLKLPFYLWTCDGVVELIEREYGIKVSSTTAGRYLKAWGLTPQKPVRRAYERNNKAIQQWLKEDYPAWVKKAKREGATIYWGDEAGLRSDTAMGRSYALAGQTPAIRATGKRFGCNMISAISNQGHLNFMVFQGGFVGSVFIDFLRRLLKQTSRKVYLIVDGHPVHKSKAAERFVEDNSDRLRLIFLPGYAPELNPDELLNHDVKKAIATRSRPTNRNELMSVVRSHLRRRQKQPAIVKAFFREKHVQYAA